MKPIVTNLVSKIQYDNFEEGEFCDIKSRSFEITWKLIQEFPWQEFRHTLFRVKLTNPSVTLEQQDEKSYLKVSMYYYDKFIVYYLAQNGKLSFVIVDQLDEVVAIIKLFFENKVSEIKWRKYFEWVLNKKKKFATNSFEYIANFRGILRLIGTEITIIPIILLLLIILDHVGISEILICFLGLIIFVLPQLILFFNYFFFSKKQYLKLSRWNDEFYFKDKRNMKTYNKQNISKIASISNNWMRIPWNNFHIFKIYFRDGTTIKFTNMIINSFVFEFKFPEQHIKDEHKFFPIA